MKPCGRSLRRTRKAENNLKTIQNQEQNLTWQIQKIIDKQKQKQEKLLKVISKIEEIEAELPNPLPEIPFLVNAKLL